MKRRRIRELKQTKYSSFTYSGGAVQQAASFAEEINGSGELEEILLFHSFDSNNP
jgi:hypothetical protein